jgi:hypothetical protein
MTVMAKDNRYGEGQPLSRECAAAWQTVILTPTGDFVGPVKQANRQTAPGSTRAPVPRRRNDWNGVFTLTSK